jgi:hypothetical protein
MKNRSIMPLIILAVVALSLIVFIASALAYTNYISERTLSPISEVSTRYHVPKNLTQLPFDTVLLVNSAILKFGAGCPPEIAIYVHGFNRNDTEAREEFNRVQILLNYNNYRIPLIGFSWNSKTDYPLAQSNAKNNGPKLANIIIDFNKRCPDTHIRLVSHSLGASVVESALVNLDNNQTLKDSISNNNSKIINSVHLLGAAINNKSIVNNTSFVNATENIVDKFYNLYNPQDDGLEYNREIENQDPLGLVGAANGTTPLNYNDTNVAYEIPPFSDADGDGNLEECFEDIKPVRAWGDNHCGYIGFRNPFVGSFSGDDAMNVVVRDWLKS